MKNKTFNAGVQAQPEPTDKEYLSVHESSSASVSVVKDSLITEGKLMARASEQTIAHPFLSCWERTEVRVRPLPNVAEILEA